MVRMEFNQIEKIDIEGMAQRLKLDGMEQCQIEQNRERWDGIELDGI